MEQERVVFREAKGVRLVHLQESDAETLVRFINDPEITRFVTRVTPLTLEQEKEWINKTLKGMDDNPVFGIEIEGGRLIGTMGLSKINLINGTAISGASIGCKDCWGKGYGTTAKMLLLKYAFTQLDLRIVYSHVLAFNERSVAYSRKCGYKHVATLPKKHFVDGKYVDNLILQVTPDTWRPQYEAWYSGEKLPVDVGH